MATSKELFERALRVVPGGVNSPVRAFKAVGGEPVYVRRGSGARIETVEGELLTDYCCSWGPLIVGHAHPVVVEAIQSAAASGTSFGINTPGEVEFAELLCSLIPSIEQIRLVNSGTEAVMTALRLARGITGRQKIIKFDGCYHGHSDGVLVSAGSGLLTGGITTSAGVSRAMAEDVYVPAYNDSTAVDTIVEEHGEEIAAIIVEPVAGNMGLVEPREGFLERLRSAADRCGALLIFDEVITGFRLGPTAYSVLCGITPDLTCLGKIIGGGLPIGAVGGRKEYMEHLAPEGPVYQAGTLSGNPIAIVAGKATIQVLLQENPYPELARLGSVLAAGIEKAAWARGLPMHCAVTGGMFTPFFRMKPIQNLEDAKKCDTAMHASFFRAMLSSGIYLPPSQFEVGFISSAHNENDIEKFITAVTAWCKTL